MTQRQNQELADKLFPAADVQAYSESILSVPPEQRRLHTETLDFTISTIVEYLSKGHLYIPEYQRRYVWTQAQASKLIESLIIQCPIPVIYLNQEPDEKLSVIDGNQRIRSLSKFLENQFELRGLTAYPELDGLRFYQLDPRFQRHIQNRTLRCIVIMKDTHPQVKFDVFERLNTGSVKLTPQELRHGMYHGKLMTLVGDLAKHNAWQELFAIDSKRMKLEEFVIRFFALHFDIDSYKKPLSSFLNSFAEVHRDLDVVSEPELRTLFTSMVEGVSHVYGKLAFKVYDRNLNVLSKFNAAVFDAEVLSISQSRKPVRQLTAEQRAAFYADFATLFLDSDFYRCVTLATSDVASLKLRTSMVNSVVQRHL